MKKFKALFLAFLPFLSSLLAFVLFTVKNSPEGLNWLWFIIITIIMFVVGTFISVIVHEGGHGVFGAISGYKLTSFKFGPFSVEYDGEKYKFVVSKMNAWILGQCLMAPPKYKKNRKIKFNLYNAGGLIFSYGLLAILLLLVLLINNDYLCWLLTPIIVVDLFLAISNSIYTETGINDVCNCVRVKKNSKLLPTIMYELEVTTNIFLGKRYGAKTTYKPYYEYPLDHITMPALEYELYYEIDHEDYDKMKELILILSKSYYKLMYPMHRFIANLDIMWFDLVVEKNFQKFKNHFNRITDIEKKYTLKKGTDAEVIYKMYEKIINKDYNIEEDINNLLQVEDIKKGEKLSLEKRYNMLKEALKEL